MLTLPGGPMRQGLRELGCLVPGPWPTACALVAIWAQLFLPRSVQTPFCSRLCSTCLDPTPFCNSPSPFPGPQGVGGDDWTRYYVVIKKKTNRKMCAFFFFLFLLAASKCLCFPNGLIGLPRPPLRCSLPVLLAPGAAELSQQHQLHGERLLSNLVTRVPKKAVEEQCLVTVLCLSLYKLLPHPLFMWASQLSA